MPQWRCTSASAYQRPPHLHPHPHPHISTPALPHPHPRSNSLAHWAGDATYTDGHTARNSIITAVCTVGEGYHNFHHE